MNYDDYLPYIDVEDGMSRVLNIDLYLKLLGKFNPRQMANAVLAAIEAGDKAVVVQTVHAMRGIAGNLSLPALQTVTEQIEELAKKDMDYSHLADNFNSIVDESVLAIDKLIASV